MVRRRREPEEALGPALDGNDQLARLEMFLVPEEYQEPESEIGAEADETPDSPILLVCGEHDPAADVARLASECGFVIEVAVFESLAEDSPLAQLAGMVHVLDQEENIVSACGVERNYYVCIFESDERLCERLLLECLASDAAYLGVWASAAKADAIFGDLKRDGAPDAELAAVCCPMGLGIGAVTPRQEAVAVVAELMAAKTGALKRLRYTD